VLDTIWSRLLRLLVVQVNEPPCRICRVDPLNINPWNTILMSSRMYGSETAIV
jgi:hypothetical protein